MINSQRRFSMMAFRGHDGEIDGIDRCLSNLNEPGSAAKSKIKRCIVTLAETRLDPSAFSLRPQSGLADTPSQLSWRFLRGVPTFSLLLLCASFPVVSSLAFGFVRIHCSRPCSLRSPQHFAVAGPSRRLVLPDLRLRSFCHRPSTIWHDRIARPFRPRSPTLAHYPRTPHPWVRRPFCRERHQIEVLTASTVEKRPSTDGLVDNIDPRESHELDELPYVEKPAEPQPISLKDKLITCFWIAINTLSTLGLIFLSKRCAYT